MASFDIQHQIRQNAQETKNLFDDLKDWTKDIEKEDV
jgi:hypothetical protein